MSKENQALVIITGINNYEAVLAALAGFAITDSPENVATFQKFVKERDKTKITPFSHSEKIFRVRLTAEVVEEITAEKCGKCDGCGFVADTERQEPWSSWLMLPIISSAATILGVVRAIPCPVCHAPQGRY